MTDGNKNDARRGQSEEDRLLEKAKRYVEKQEREKSGGDRDDKKRSHRDRDDSDDARRHKKSSRDHHHHKSSSRRDRDKEKDGDRKGRKDRDRDHSRKKRERSHSRSRSRSRDRSADRNRRGDDDRRQSKKSKKKDRKHSDKKKHAKHSKDHKDDRHRAKPPSPSQLYPLGPIASKPPADPIDAEADYFAFHQHFRLFLYRTKGIYFEDLSSTETHKMFGKFADKYNNGELEEGYYEAKLPEEATEQCKRTQHKWSFKTNATEQQSLEMVRAGVKKQTEWSVPAGGNANQSGPGPTSAAVSAAVPPRGGDEYGRRGRKTPEEIQKERAANRRLREHAKTTHEELTGGKADYGRDRQLEKKREKAAKMHGSHRDKEAETMGGPDLDDDTLYGGGRDTSFQQALAREKSRKARREQQRTERIGELQKKEDDKAKAMLDMLGLSNIKPGQKIQIAPRKD